MTVTDLQKVISGRFIKKNKIQKAGMNVLPKLEASQWVKFFELKEPMYPLLVQKFWENTKEKLIEAKLLIRTRLNGKPYAFSLKNIQEANGCPIEGADFADNQEDSIGEAIVNSSIWSI